MDFIHRFTNTISYELNISLNANSLNLILKINDQSTYKRYQLVLENSKISSEIKKYFQHTNKLFEFLGNQNNFLIDPINGKIALLLRGGRKSMIELMMRETERINKLEEDNESKYGEDKRIYELEFPSFEEQFKDEFDQMMGEFQIEMQIFKSQLKRKLQRIQHSIKWDYTNSHGDQCSGQYEGQAHHGQPNGIGRFTLEGGSFKIEGEWKNGKIDGRGVVYHHDGNRSEYEKKQGKLDGKYIWFWNDGGREEMQYRDGKQHGRFRKYNKKGIIQSQYVSREGHEVERII